MRWESDILAERRGFCRIEKLGSARLIQVSPFGWVGDGEESNDQREVKDISGDKNESVEVVSEVDISELDEVLVEFWVGSATDGVIGLGSIADGSKGV